MGRGKRTRKAMTDFSMELVALLCRYKLAALEHEGKNLQEKDIAARIGIEAGQIGKWKGAHNTPTTVFDYKRLARLSPGNQKAYASKLMRLAGRSNALLKDLNELFDPKKNGSLFPAGDSSKKAKPESSISEVGN